MMMALQQTLCMTSLQILQPGPCVKSLVRAKPRGNAGLPGRRSSRFQEGRRSSTFLAAEQAPSLFFSPDDASDGGVPVRDTEVCDSTGTKTLELMDLISPTKLGYTIDDELPPLKSMVIDGFPPIQHSNYLHKAKKCLLEYVQCYPNVISLDYYCRIGLFAAAYGHPKVINVDRLVVISLNYALLFLLDDLFFDTPDEFLQDQYGVSCNICASPQKIQEYLDYLDAIFGQQVQPSNHAPLIETLMWDLGRDTLKLSNLEWFNHYIASVVEHHRACVTSHADIVQGRNLSFQDLNSYALMRAGNVGGKFIQMMIEFAKDTYIVDILRTNPSLESITMAASIHIGFANDIFSYHKESLLEQNPRNLITVLMECEGKPFAKTVHMAIDLTNAYAQAIMDLESQAWNSTLQNHLQDVIALIAGGVYFGLTDKRYRHLGSFFVELRDI